RDLQRRFSRDPQDRNSDSLPSLPSLSSAIASLPPLRSLGSRRGPMSTSGGSSRPSRYRPGERYLSRHRDPSEHRGAGLSFEDLEHNLEDANSHLRQLLEYTNNNPIMSPLAPSLVSPPPQPQDHTE